jgi:hypothetical protein
MPPGVIGKVGADAVAVRDRHQKTFGIGVIISSQMFEPVFRHEYGPSP